MSYTAQTDMVVSRSPTYRAPTVGRNFPALLVEPTAKQATSRLLLISEGNLSDALDANAFHFPHVRPVNRES
jgi:hypothetical protein